MSAITIIQGLIKGSQGIIGVAQRRTVTLTAAQILALNTTPITLIPAPAAGKYIEVLGAVAKLNFGTTQYTGANNLELRYTNGSGAKVTSDVASALIDAAATRADKLTPAAATMVAAAPVVAVVPTANPAAGDGTITIDLLYRTVTNS